MKLKVCLDRISYKEKPEDKRVMGQISMRLPHNPVELELVELADLVGRAGHAFSPAQFNGGKRTEKSVKEIQIFGIDIDGRLSIEDAMARAARYKLPVAFAYHTFRSTEKRPRFRLIFVNDIPVKNMDVAKIIIKMLLKIFPEADKNCSDVSRFFLGGKGLIGEVNEETINIADLTYHFQQYLFETDPKKYIRNLICFAHNNKILLENNCLKITRVRDDDSDMGEKTADDVYIYMSDAEKSPKYIIKLNYQNNVRNFDRKMEVFRADLSKMEEKCRLYRDFVREDHIPHENRFLLMTNMIHLEGGIKRFKKQLEKHSYDMKAWSYYIKYAKDANYLPQACNGNCSYDSICQHKTNMALTVKESTRIRKLDENEIFFNLDEVHQHICNCFEKAVNVKAPGIHLINAQTAVGKTQVYCSYIAHDSTRRFLIAVPTNRLKHEVWSRLNEMGVDAMETISLDEMQLPEGFLRKIQYYYQLGLGRRIITLVKNFIKENDKIEDWKTIRAISQCKEYLDNCSKIETSRIVVTTHAKLSTFSEDIVRDFIVIIDEDILSTFFKNIQTASMDDIRKAAHADNCPESLRTRLSQIINTSKGTYSRFLTKMSYDCLEESELETLSILSDINNIAFASTFVHDGENVNYFYPMTIPKASYIVLSATAEAGLYRNYFQSEIIIEYPYKKARYQGKLKQLTAYTMSRQSILTHKKRLIQYLKSLKDAYKMITFLKYEDELNGSGLHFGNAEGIDIYGGQNIIVVGTPHMSEFIYKLIGCHLGLEVNKNALAERKVQYHGYEFGIMTYADGELRQLQLFFIKKELEQCIGRARLLRHDCEVLVLSNFPCEQAEIDQTDYLEGFDNPV